MEIENQPRLKNFNLNSLISTQFIQQSLFVTCKLERFSLDCRKTKTKVNTLANQRA